MKTSKQPSIESRPTPLAHERYYLGDGVYAETDGYHIILTVPGDSHASGHNQRIALEPSVLADLNAYVRDLHRRAARSGA